MTLVFSFSLKEHKVEAYRQWVIKNEKAIRAAAPRGVKYLGTYFYVLGFAGTGRYDAENWFELDTWAALDRWREHDDKNWRRQMGEFLEFVDPNQPTEARVLRAASDVQITEPRGRRR